MRNQFDEFSNDYEQVLASSTGNLSKDGRFHQAKLDALLQRLPQVRNARLILDFGCGIGGLIGFLANNFPKTSIIGCDPSVQSLGVARATHGGNSRIHFHQNIPATESFDLILAANVFHHIQPEARAETLHMLRRHISPQGRLVVFEHNPLNPLTRFVVGRCPLDVDAVLVSRRSFTRLARDCGFSVEAGAYFLLLPVRAVWFRRIESLLCRIPFGAQYFISLTPRGHSAS